MQGLSCIKGAVVYLNKIIKKIILCREICWGQGFLS